MSDAQGYLRCTHCRGFYESDLESCKWCDYDVPLLQSDGKPKVFPDRQTCRNIQVAEYEQLPKVANDDPMGPPMDCPELICACLHCGNDGHEFEVIEMRWIETESMWACPCTTCGGRGFNIDIHPVDLGWECVECGHRYAPDDDRYVTANCKCPKCGCTEANGWWEDEDYDEDDQDFDDDDEHFIPDSVSPVEQPWQNDVREWKPGGDEADDDSDDANGEEKLLDDIDFPHHRPPPAERRSDGSDGFNEDDIPF